MPAGSELFAEHRDDAKELDDLVGRKMDVRAQLGAADASIEPFLVWFDRHFLKRVTPRAEASS
jgi:predicted secreted hydrolase